MTTIDLATHDTAAHADVSRAPSALAAWLTSSDHKRLGRLMVGCGSIGLVGVAVVSAVLAIVRRDAGSAASNADVTTQLFAASRVGLVFMAVLPIMLGIAVAIVPLQLGARSLAFPRLATAGFWAWFFGTVLVVIAIAANGGPGGGSSDMVALFLSGFTVVLLGLTAIAVALATTVLTTRAPGMNMRRVPLFSWSVLVSALGLVLMLPVAVGTLIYLYVSYRYNRTPFGGNQGVLRYLGFSLTQPQTYVYVLPAIGFLAEMIPVSTRRRLPLRGVVFTGLALVSVAALSGVTQSVHSLPWSGSGLNFDDFGTKFGDLLDFGFFNVLPLLGVLVVILAGAAAFKGAKVKIAAPFVFALFGLGMVLIGMGRGVLGNIPDLSLDTAVFEQGTYVYVGYGAILVAMGALVYWGPKLWGRVIPDRPAMGIALLGLLATILAALPMNVDGLADPAVADANFNYGGSQKVLNILSLVGHGLMALAVLAFIALALKAFRKGELAGDDPWNAQTLEWATTSPAPEQNFVDQHTVMSAEPLVDLKPSSYSLGEGNS